MNGNTATVTFHNSLADGQAEACAFLLGGEKGDENILMLAWRNAGAIVFDLEFHHVVGSSF